MVVVHKYVPSQARGHHLAPAMLDIAATGSIVRQLITALLTMEDVSKSALTRVQVRLFAHVQVDGGIARQATPVYPSITASQIMADASKSALTTVQGCQAALALTDTTFQDSPVAL